ncbi:unnamed protein product, partial [Ectocarpus sp. 8 AP-2014]
QVSPASGSGVSRADELLREDLRGPELRAHKRGAHHADEEADDSHVGGAVHQAGEGGRDTPHDEQGAGDDARSEGVAEGAHDETREHGGGHGRDVGVVHLELGHAEVGLDLLHEGGEGEPGDEGHEETEPREVEGSHVGASEAVELEHGGLVLLLGVDGHVIAVVCA